MVHCYFSVFVSVGVSLLRKPGGSGGTEGVGRFVKVLFE